MLSILVPTYNRARLLDETISNALASIGSQDELIIRDNASTDGSQALLEALAAQDVRICLVLAESNSGPVNNWLECLRLARGTHIKLLFSDDLMFPEPFRRYYDTYLKGGFRVGFTSALIGTQVSSSAPEFLLTGAEPSMSAPEFERLTLRRLGSVPVSPSAFVFESALLSRCFYEAMNMLEDKPEAMATGAGIDLLIVTLAVRHAGKACYVREPSIFFRQHSGSISTEKSRLVKQLYNLARVRFAALTAGRLQASAYGVGYVIGDLVSSIRQVARRLRALVV